MATNRHSCAVNVSILLSLIQITCVLYLAYAISFNLSAGRVAPTSKYNEHQQSINQTINTISSQASQQSSIQLSVDQNATNNKQATLNQQLNGTTTSGQQQVGNRMMRIKDNQVSKSADSSNQLATDNKNYSPEQAGNHSIIAYNSEQQKGSLCSNSNGGQCSSFLQSKNYMRLHLIDFLLNPNAQVAMEYNILQQNNNSTSSTSSYSLVILAILFVQMAIDVVLLIKNGQIKESYWQLELVAIKATYNKSEGKRSMRSSLQTKSTSNYLSKKQEKQMILRKLQYDIVNSYFNWYLLLMFLKLSSVVAALNKFFSILSTDAGAEASQLNNLGVAQASQSSSNLQALQLTNTAALTDLQGNQMVSSTLSSLESMDLALLILIICRVVEALNSLLVKRWLNNIKIDIVKFIRLVKSRNVYLHTEESTGLVIIKAKDGETLGDAEDVQDFNAFILAIQKTRQIGYTPQSAESYVVENLWEILCKNGGNTDNAMGTEQLMPKEYLYGANSLLDQSINGIINDFYDSDLDSECDRGNLIRKSVRRSPSHNSNSGLLHQIISDNKSRRSRTSNRTGNDNQSNHSVQSDNKNNNVARLSAASEHTSIMAKATIFL